jgi:CHAD domain-containing protein
LAAIAHGVLSAQALRLCENLDSIVQCSDPASIHNARVAIRRARCALKLFGSALADARCTPLRRELRWLAAALSPLRDVDVVAAHIREHYRSVPATRQSRTQIAACLAALRAPAQAATSELVRSPRATATIRMLTAVAGAVDAPGDARQQHVVPDGARLLRKLAKRTLAVVPNDATPDALHRFRIECKRLRYACEFLAADLGKPVRALARKLVKVQDCLGRHQDAMVAQLLLPRIADDVLRQTACGPETLLTIGALLERERTVAAAMRGAVLTRCAAAAAQANHVRSYLRVQRAATRISIGKT